VESAKKIKLQGGDNDLIARILADSSLGMTEKEMNNLLSAEQFTGRAKEQTEEFLSEVKNILDKNKELLGVDVKITV